MKRVRALPKSRDVFPKLARRQLDPRGVMQPKDFDGLDELEILLRRTWEVQQNRPERATALDFRIVRRGPAVDDSVPQKNAADVDGDEEKS
jgi:hypothetical protein